MRKFTLALLVVAGIHYGLRAQGPTWAKDIAPILYTNCTGCHHVGALAPNPLMTYTEAYNYRHLIKQYVDANYMPPWPPDHKYKRLAHERVISQSDKDKISQWVLAGAPEGNVNDAPAPPTYTTTGSELSSIDYSAKMQDYVVNTSTDLYRCFIINTNFTTDKFASEIEVIPGNREIVHHVLVYEDTTQAVVVKDSADAGAGYTSFFGTGSNDSRLIGEWVPGTAPIKFPPGMGLRIRKNTRLILQVHYPKGTYLELDSTRVNIRFAPGVLREVFLVPAISENNLVNGPLVIPPNAVQNFTAASTATINTTLPFGAFTILSVAPHMHLIGKDVKVFSIEKGTGDTLPLINIPRWDFKWQGIYNFRNPIKIVEGSTLVAHASYDNTDANPNNPNSPPIQVVHGESTSDEMLLVFFAFTYYLPGDENIVIDNSPLVGLAEHNKDIVNSLQVYDIFPNPARTKTSARYYSPVAGPADVSVIAADGKLVRRWIKELHAGYGEISLNLENMEKGSYFLKVKSSSGIRTRSFIIYE